MSTPANWHPDPTGRHQHRYWDGQQWTDHVSDNGAQSLDPVDSAAPTAPGTVDRAPADGGTLFTEPVLVVNQKAKIIELNNQYSVFDANGRQIAAVNQVGQSAAKKVLRLVSSLDQFLTHKLEITDSTGRVALRLTRPAKIMKSTIVVTDANDTEIGRIVQENVIGKINFSLQAGGSTYGYIKAENWRAWNFRIEDHTGREIARITKTWEGLAKTMFTTADNYVVQIHEPLPQPLNALVVASALSIDTALKQDSRGFG